MTFFAARGGPINEGRMAINGMTIAAPFNGGGVSTYILDSINTDEISVTVAGGVGSARGCRPKAAELQPSDAPARLRVVEFGWLAEGESNELARLIERVAAEWPHWLRLLRC